MEKWSDGIGTKFGLRGHDERLTLVRIEDRRIARKVAQQICDELSHLRRAEVRGALSSRARFEARCLAQRERRIFELGSHERQCALVELAADRVCYERTGDDEALKRAQARTVCVTLEVKSTQSLALALVDGLAEPVGEERVMGDALAELDSEET